jgi:hypothetical protein
MGLPRKTLYEASLGNEASLGISKRGCNFLPPINMERGSITIPA